MIVQNNKITVFALMLALKGFLCMFYNIFCYFKVTKMYEDVLKEKENLGIKIIQGEEEKKKMTRENELLGRKVSENAKVYMSCYYQRLQPSLSFVETIRSLSMLRFLHAVKLSQSLPTLTRGKGGNVSTLERVPGKKP